MPRSERKVTRADILSLDDFAAIRDETRAKLIAVKRNRRIEVGPHVAFYFESFDTIWMQIHEMLRIEKGGEAQIEDELTAYNPLIPDGRELVATMMIEIGDAEHRRRVLATLGGIEDSAVLKIGGKDIRAEPEMDAERTTAEGKASAVHFLHFPFSGEDIATFRDPAADCLLGVEHPNYSHFARLSPAVRAELAKDFA